MGSVGEHSRATTGPTTSNRDLFRSQNSGKMTELKLCLAHSEVTEYESFRVTAEGSANLGDHDSREGEGKALADLLFDRLPSGTIDAMIKRLRFRYSQFGNVGNPFR